MIFFLHTCPFVTEKFAVSSESSRSRLDSNTIRLLADCNCFVRFGDSTVLATVDDMPLYAGWREYFSMAQTRFTHVAAITAPGVSGSLFITGCK